MADRWGGKQSWQTVKLCSDVDPATREKARKKKMKQMKRRMQKRKAEVQRLEMEVQMMNLSIAQSKSAPSLLLPEMSSRISKSLTDGETPFGELSLNIPSHAKTELRCRRKKKADKLPRINHTAHNADHIDNLHKMMDEQSTRPWRQSFSRNQSHGELPVASMASADGQSWRREMHRKRKEGEKQFYIDSASAMKRTHGDVR